MTKSLIMIFKTVDNKVVKVTIHDPKEGITRATVEPIAQKIVETGVFNTEKHTISSLKKVVYVTREETILN